MYINRCISITVLSIGSHKFARCPVHKLYRNSVRITATLSAMLSWCCERLRVVAASAAYSCHHTFTIYLQKNQSASYPSKRAAGLNPKTKSGPSARSRHLTPLYRVYRNTVKVLHYRKYFTAWYFPISERLPDIWM
jgi:hypothetical protein